MLRKQISILQYRQNKCAENHVTTICLQKTNFIEIMKWSIDIFYGVSFSI